LLQLNFSDNVNTIFRLNKPVGRVDVRALEWGLLETEKAAALIAQDPLDWVLAADCVYVDNVSREPVRYGAMLLSTVRVPKLRF
jgi:hypothetical protein